MPDFAQRIIAWQKRHGRSGLPWQGTRDPYRIWVSEIMLQQTQVAAVIPYYERFLARFPTIDALARAGEDDVLALWSGLGYYARARNLHRAAKEVARMPAFPRSADEIAELPGIGRSTASAIAAFAYGTRAAILDGNVKRVLARVFGVEGWPGETTVEERLWRLAESLLPRRGIETYTQGLMDLGATVCTRLNPGCERCPMHEKCVARRKSRVASIPAPRPRKALPSRQATWLLLVRAGEVLLEKRPSAGLWGGLWTFPEAGGKDVAGFCRRALGCEVSAVKKLPSLEHGFTHFRLRIRPLLCRVKKVSALAESSGRLWLGFSEAERAAVPAPVKALIARLVSA